MLRIDTRAEPEKVTLKLEGDLTGIWVSELFDAWRSALSNPSPCPLCVDLSAVGRVDKAGEYLLALMQCTCGTELISSGIITRDLIRSIARDWPIVNSNAVKEA